MVIEFAIDHYNRFLALCDPASREYEIVKNGLVIRRVKNGNRQYERVVEIFAEMRDAYLLLDMANKICPTPCRLSQKLCLWRATCSVNLPFKARLASVYPCDLYLEWRIWLDNFATTEEILSCGMMFAFVADEKIF
ncbi:MAG TPA: hypothetical protein VJ248_05680 [Candidatus Udaeobacter sp.]|nr:hypothetical protein [Candidatus Udaeobacter sp.]